MATVSPYPAPRHATRPATAPADRAVTLHAAPSATMPGILTIRTPRATVGYLVLPIPSAWGAGYRLRKCIADADGPDHYDVHLAAGGGTCECKGHLRWGHCKHVDALRALRDAGQLAGRPDAASPDTAA